MWYVNILILTTLTASEIVQNISQIIGAERDPQGDPSTISSLDVVLVADIFSRTLNATPPTVADRDNYMRIFDSIQSVSPVQLRAANEKAQSVQGSVTSLHLWPA